MSKYCANCGSQMNENARFCMDCGVKLTQIGAPSVGNITISPVFSSPSISSPPKRTSNNARCPKCKSEMKRAESFGIRRDTDKIFDVGIGIMHDDNKTFGHRCTRCSFKYMHDLDLYIHYFCKSCGLIHFDKGTYIQCGKCGKKWDRKQFLTSRDECLKKIKANIKSDMEKLGWDVTALQDEYIQLWDFLNLQYYK